MVTIIVIGVVTWAAGFGYSLDLRLSLVNVWQNCHVGFLSSHLFGYLLFTWRVSLQLA